VTDNHGMSGSSNVTIVVNAALSAPANQIPVANPGGNAAITLPTNSVSLDASASYDPDGSVVSYNWVQSSGPSSSSIANILAAKTTVSNLVQGVYVYTLQVKDNAGALGNATKTITVNAAATSGQQPVGYIKTSTGPYQACADASSTGRTAVYSNNIANGSLLYLDAAHTKLFDGGWNWYSFTPSVGGTVTQAFAVYPNGSVNLLTSCNTSTPPVTQPVAPSGTLLGYIKMSTGPYQACADASSTSRIAVYGTSIANGSYLYTDAALTQKYNGGWNWFSFTPALGGSTTYAFAVYPTGGILLARSCANGGARLAEIATATTAEQDVATLIHLKDSAMAAEATIVRENKLTMYPNPVSSSATIELYSKESGAKNIYIYNSKGVLAARYVWQAVKGKNVFSIKNISGLTNGLYIIDIREISGKSDGTLKFLKIN
ncbi:MAG: T9SS type A sorting domain-containing protein, partial [Bacteroidota bacterium]